MQVPTDNDLTYNLFSLIICIKNKKTNNKYYLVYFPELEDSLINNVTQGYSFANAVYMGFDFLMGVFQEDNKEFLNKLCNSIHQFDKSMNYIDRMKATLKQLEKNEYLDKHDEVVYKIGIPIKIKMAYEYRKC